MSDGRTDKRHPSLDAYARHVDPSAGRASLLGNDRVFVRARGATLWDHEGREYLDFSAGDGTASYGHRHPRIVDGVRAQLADAAPAAGFGGVSPFVAHLAEQLAHLAGHPLSMAMLATGNAEAIEGASKLARAVTGRRHLLSCAGGHHGRSLGTLSIAGDARERGLFPPLLDACDEVPFGELVALEEAMNERKYAAFIVEPLQVEGGVRVAPPGYLKRAQELCRKSGALLVLDEVHTGLGRTGKTFGFEHEGFLPDILVLGGALGGGLFPLGATMASREVFDRGGPLRDLVGSTFAGDTLACTAAIEGVRVLTEEQLSENAAARGEQLLTGLRDRLHGHPLVREVRGRGLLVGIELGATVTGGFLDRIASSLTGAVSKKVFGQWLALRLLEEGIVCQPTLLSRDVLKLQPPLTITAAQIDRVVSAIAELLGRYRDVGGLLKDVGERFGKQLLGGGS